MRFTDLFRKKKKEVYPEYLYTEEELNEYEEYVTETFGKFDKVFHEVVSPDIHLDVVIIPPGRDPFYRLVTMGAGAYAMNIPDDLVLYNLKHAEYTITLPADWNLNSSAEEDYWPIRILKSTARIPVQSGSWLGTGHTIHGNADKAPFATNTRLNSILLMPAIDRKNGCEASVVLGSSRKKINFYELVPLYQNELEYKFEHGYDAFLDMIPDEAFPLITRPDRKNWIE